MIAVAQRVQSARVVVDQCVVGSIARGLLVLLGVGRQDDEEDARILADRCLGLRIFDDQQGKMNLSLAQVGGELLAVSQFTLLADCTKGRRPSFLAAAPPDDAKRLYERFVSLVSRQGVSVATGVFQAQMQVELINDGPVTLILDSRTWRA